MIARVFGMSKKRVERIEKMVGENMERSRKEEELLRAAFKKLNRNELRTLKRSIKEIRKNDTDLDHCFLDHLLLLLSERSK